MRYRTEYTHSLTRFFLNSLRLSVEEGPFNWFNQLWAINHRGWLNTFYWFFLLRFLLRHKRQLFRLNCGFFSSDVKINNFTLVWKTFSLNFENSRIIQVGCDFRQTKILLNAHCNFSFFLHADFFPNTPSSAVVKHSTQRFSSSRTPRRHEADQNIRVIDFCFPPGHDTTQM